MKVTIDFIFEGATEMEMSKDLFKKLQAASESSDLTMIDLADLVSVKQLLAADNLHMSVQANSDDDAEDEEEADAEDEEEDEEEDDKPSLW